MEGMAALMPLPAPWKAFAENEALFYRGEISLLAGPPGSMKTITALNVANQIAVPTLYISNDSTRYTIICRAFAMLTGHPQKVAEQIVQDNPELAFKVLKGWENIRFDFHSSPTVERMLVYGEAFRVLYGEYPHLTIVDIMMNISHDGVADQKYWQIFGELKELAVLWNTALVAVHHTKEGVKPNPCPPSSAIMGMANHLQALIVTMIGQDDSILYNVVKNRNGASAPAGDRPFQLPVEPAKCRIYEAKQDTVPISFRDGPSVPPHQKVGTR